MFITFNTYYRLMMITWEFLVHSPEFLEQRVFVLFPDLHVHVVIRPAHTRHVARPPHCPAPRRAIRRDNLQKVRKLETL